MEFLRQNARRVVVKLGTNILASGGGKFDAAQLESFCSQVHALRERGLEVVLVSSGAIGLGMGKLGMTKRPTELESLQACAAIGQTILMDAWRRGFEARGLICAQILLTRDDVGDRKRHLAVKNTFNRLLKLGVVPVVNENDTVSVDEIKFGDNDILSSLTASLIDADLLVILSTIPGLIDREGTGQVVNLIPEITPEIEAMAGGTDSPTAVGGMKSKITAAKVAVRSGCGVFIGSGRARGLLIELADGTAEGTFFVPQKVSLEAKKRWMAFFERPHGTIKLDAGAVTALRARGSSLLAKGITGVGGEFASGEIVGLEGPDGRIVARGVARYAAQDLKDLVGASNAQLQARFPGRKRLEVVHRNDLVVL